MPAPILIGPAPGAGWLARGASVLRGWFSRRALLRLAGVPVVVLDGRVYGVRPVSLGVARDMVPALVRCSRRFAEWQIDEALYDDLVVVLSRGLRTSPQTVGALTVPLWELGPVIEVIARANGMPVVEAAGRLGEIAALTKSTGMPSSPASSAPPAGPSSTSSST